MLLLRSNMRKEKLSIELTTGKATFSVAINAAS